MWKSLSLVLAVIILSSCQAARRAKLEENVKTYFLALRRSDQTAVLSYVHPDQQQSFYENSQSMSAFHISNVEVEAVFPDDELETAVVSAQLEYYSQGGTLLETTKRQFLWKYHEEAKTWLLQEKQPFGSALARQ